ncbi:MAG: response regulator [Chloroflexi bacterium]|nr:response regulator [Chloroflexota bacterium]MCL5110244.1 response regulator [Chloroflexota bacterium]
MTISTAGAKVAKILVVDDEEYIVDLLSLLLEDDGHVPLRAYNGREALEMVIRDRPTLVIADVMMPVMDGEALVRAIKGDPNLAQTPVILMSALGNLRRRVGADDFVTKPFDLELVRRVIQRHLNDDGGQ